MPQTFSTTTRSELLRKSRFNGIEDVEIGRDRQTLIVRFFHDAPQILSPSHLHLTGGVAIIDIGIVDVRLIDPEDPDQPIYAEVSVDRVGDASTYELRAFDIEGFDPRFSRARFTFFPENGKGADSASLPASSFPAVGTPPIDYLAKDYAGFRQLMLDRLAVTMPDWIERHIPDVQLMLVELLAYTADRLSYYQDAVATEAYLATARRRLSVARHARLVDYRMHEGCVARVLVQIDPATDEPLPVDGLSFTVGSGPAAIMFTPITGHDSHARLRVANTMLRFHCWGDSGCILPKGSVAATLIDTSPDETDGLRAGDYLILELINPLRGNQSDPDVANRHPVRLTMVRRATDPLLDVALIEVAWAPDDATPFDLPLDATVGGDGLIAVARGNLVPAQEGKRIVDGDHRSATPIAPRVGPGRRRTLPLSTAGLSYAASIGRRDSARAFISAEDPRCAVPLIDSLLSWPAEATEFTISTASRWEIRPDLIESGPDALHATVEMDDGGVATLRFGDGVCGRDPSGNVFEITYWVSIGPRGNVGAGAISAAHHQAQPGVAAWGVRNPLPASGGLDPEDAAQVKLLAPTAFRDVLVRAVRADDYAALAVQLEPDVQRATCDFVRVGVRTIARIAIDPLGSDAPNLVLATRVATALAPYRSIGHDVEVSQGRYTPLILVLAIEIAHGHLQSAVRVGLRAALTAGLTADGRPGPFHPDMLTFGTPIYGSRVVAAAQAVSGVESVAIVEFARLFDRQRGGYANGILRMGWNEIPQLEGDPMHPDHGELILHLSGGRP